MADPEGYVEIPVRRSESHWYLNVIEHGCVLCGYGDGVRRVRMAGSAPEDPADRWKDDGRGDWACGDHFC